MLTAKKVMKMKQIWISQATIVKIMTITNHKHQGKPDGETITHTFSQYAAMSLASSKRICEAWYGGGLKQMLRQGVIIDHSATAESKRSWFMNMVEAFTRLYVPCQHETQDLSDNRTVAQASQPSISLLEWLATLFARRIKTHGAET